MPESLCVELLKQEAAERGLVEILGAYCQGAGVCSLAPFEGRGLGSTNTDLSTWLEEEERELYEPGPGAKVLYCLVVNLAEMPKHFGLLFHFSWLLSELAAEREGAVPGAEGTSYLPGPGVRVSADLKRCDCDPKARAEATAVAVSLGFSSKNTLPLYSLPEASLPVVR